MNKEKEEFWNTLTEPVFNEYGCNTCKYESGIGCSHPDIAGTSLLSRCTSYKHPSTTSYNQWEWDGKTYNE